MMEEPALTFVQENERPQPAAGKPDEPPRLPKADNDYYPGGRLFDLIPGNGNLRASRTCSVNERAARGWLFRW